MENTIRNILILLSAVTGLIFATTLCYSFTTVFIARSGRTTSSEPTATAINLQATEDAGQAQATSRPVDEPTAAMTNTPEAAADEPSVENANPAPNPAPSSAGSDNLTWNGLQIEIANINYDAWLLIKVQNQNNDPPLDGMTMLMITARVTNVEGDPAEPARLDASDFQLIGDRNTVYKTFQVSCGVVPDKLDGVVAVGDSLDGNICFQISEDETDFQLIYEPYGSPAVYFELSQRSDTDFVAPEPPPVLLENEQITWDGLKVDVADIDYDAWPLIKAENQNNDPPLEGMKMLLITVRLTNVEGNSEEPVKLRDSEFKLIGSRKTVYETFRVSCGVVPDSLNAVVAKGDFLDANICFQISDDESDFQLIYEPFNSPAVYLDLPQRNPGK